MVGRWDQYMNCSGETVVGRWGSTRFDGEHELAAGVDPNDRLSSLFRQQGGDARESTNRLRLSRPLVAKQPVGSDNTDLEDSDGDDAPFKVQHRTCVSPGWLAGP